ncbi:MAG: 30S ribosomal protein S1 [Clostridia bacterium]|nr:30S ribosomal protein S1 [Clostridia bacterium]
MECQKFIPEGWLENFSPVTKDTLINAIETGEVMQGIVNKCDSNYNLYVDFGNNLKGVIPRDQIEAVNIDETGFPKPNICASKVNKYVQFKVKDIDKKDYFILSRKAVGKDALNWIKQEAKPGQIVKGIVKSIKPYGVFVEIGGGIVGLLHIEDISVARIKTPLERLSIGQKINVMIKSIDYKLERVVLSYKELLGSWEDNVKDFEEGTTVVGIAREVEKSRKWYFYRIKT